jgi:glyoxylase-like metal-dependent hydrolase (beta-lactamase superfamily II)
MRINYYVVGPLQENCYIVSGYNGAGEKDCVVIDPGDEGQTLVKGIKEAGLVPLLILLTHGHSDHTGGLSELHAEWPLAEIAMEQEDLYMLKRSEQGLPLPSRL